MRIEARRETGGGDGEVRAVGAGRAAQAEREALERAAAKAELLQPRVDLRIPLQGGGVEVEVRVETLERDAVVVEVPAVRAGDDHGLGEGAAEGSRGLDLAAGAGREQTQVVRGERKAQVEPLAQVPVQRQSRASQAEAHLLEAPDVP